MHKFVQRLGTRKIHDWMLRSRTKAGKSGVATAATSKSAFADGPMGAAWEGMESSKPGAASAPQWTGCHCTLSWLVRTGRLGPIYFRNPSLASYTWEPCSKVNLPRRIQQKGACGPVDRYFSRGSELVAHLSIQSFKRTATSVDNVHCIECLVSASERTVMSQW